MKTRKTRSVEKRNENRYKEWNEKEKEREREGLDSKGEIEGRD